MGNDTNHNEYEYICPCCGLVMVEEFEICTVCGWQSDPVQNAEPDYKGGANQESLNEARAIWQRELDRGQTNHRLSRRLFEYVGMRVIVELVNCMAYEGKAIRYKTADINKGRNAKLRVMIGDVYHDLEEPEIKSIEIVE